ncbi:hypothetical protein A0J61_11078 [Choanephora cucurbitarum]|uniref:Uncharacterized protein n=1 Tax=Choanephora cucurbitarum TaxID=101091 RepID=A0A1C7MVM5_9FUNG|nr:hypothetical protein A0J61_11078 [Choanephora cucurbitarum]
MKSAKIPIIIERKKQETSLMTGQEAANTTMPEDEDEDSESEIFSETESSEENDSFLHMNRHIENDFCALLTASSDKPYERSIVAADSTPIIIPAHSVLPLNINVPQKKTAQLVEMNQTLSHYLSLDSVLLEPGNRNI